MVTGASTADCAVILVDAEKGLLTQTRRHSYLVSLLGIRHVALAVNKMDLVGFSEERFRELEAEYLALPPEVRAAETTAIPVSGLRGDNVIERGGNLGWYDGPTLLEYLETVEVDEARLQAAPFRFPVQWVNRPDRTFRGFAGTVVAGGVAPGDRVIVLPSGRESAVERIVSYDGDLDEAVAGQAVTLTLADEVDVSRGDVIAKADARPPIADQFEVTVVWMDDAPMLPGRDYRIRIGTAAATATVSPLKYKLDVDSLDRLAADTLALNEIGVCEIELDRTIAFDPYTENRDTGGFVLIDRITNATVGAGMINFALRRSANVHWQSIDVDKAARAGLTRQQPCLIWLTGLSGAGKSTIANIVERSLHGRGHHTYLLDGDNVRHGLNKDLGFTDADRVENIRRVGEVAKLMVDAGLIVVASFISPFRSERRTVRGLVEEGEFLEVFVDAPIQVAEARDPKGLYRKARAGELKNFTGVDSPYEPPESPELRLDTSALTPEEAAEQVLAELERRGVLVPHPRT
jgi:bifunctional enzyme CysN/CysC